MDFEETGSGSGILRKVSGAARTWDQSIICLPKKKHYLMLSLIKRKNKVKQR